MHHVALAAIVLFVIILFAVSRGDTNPRRRITLSVGDTEGSMRPAKARRLARELLEKADEAEEDES